MRIKIYKFSEIETVSEITNQKIEFFYVISIYFLIIIFFSFFIWSYFGKIDLRIKGIGTIETQGNSSLIINIVSGKVKNNILIQGIKVNKGDILYEIENENLLIERFFLENEIKEKKNLYNAMNNEKYEVDTMTSNYISKKNAYLSNMKSLDIEISEQEKIKNINYEILKVGGLSEIEYEKSSNQLKLLRERKNQEEIEYNINTNNEKIVLANEIKVDELKLKSINNNIENSKIIAPITGYIEMINNINNGDTLNSDMNIAKIIPENEVYKVNIFIEENDISKIKLNNDINYHLNYPDEKRDIVLKGKVILISKDIVIKENDKKYYLIFGNINSKDIKELNLKKGMTVESNIIYSKKNILDYLLEILNFKIKTI